jgi:SET domain-containing protein
MPTRDATPAPAGKPKPSSLNGASGKTTPEIDERYTCFKLRIAHSSIHRWGVYAMEAIPAGRKVIEYTGERCNRRETKRRAGGKLNYMFTLDKYWALDGSVGGSGAEYINHSCDPNLYAKVFKGHILYICRRPIRKGEELTIDYHFGKDVERVRCACGAGNCRGTINVTE